ncbi:MAG: hypothetical protein ABI574_00935 [Burkholderiales bacterium]
MGMFSDYVQNKMTDLLYRGQAFTAPATLYFGLLICSKGARANSTSYALNDTLAILANDSKYHLYKVTTAGTTAASQSTLYPGAVGEAITDGSAVMTEQNATLDANTAQVEPSGGSYARAALTASLANWSGTQGAATTSASSGTSGQSSNNVDIIFPQPSADWVSGTQKIWGWACWDASSAGNLLDWGPLGTLQTIANGQAAPKFASTALSKTIGS